MKYTQTMVGNVILRANVNIFSEGRGNELVVGMILRQIEPPK